ncbi:hypothetical protein RSAG8_13920, partial [Rhizoctonia solani AG-8 WAC10335]
MDGAGNKEEQEQQGGYKDPLLWLSTCEAFSNNIRI